MTAPNLHYAEFTNRALGWILARLGHFDPFARRRTFEIRSGQRIGELAILARAYVGLHNQDHHAAIGEIVRLLQSVQSNRAFSDRLRRYPGELILFAQLYGCMRVLGIEAAELELSLEDTLSAGYLKHTERLPHRMMDVASCLANTGFKCSFPSLPDLYNSSILSPPPTAALLNEDSIYAITHVVMFLYDFGIRNDLSIPPEDLAAVEKCLKSLLVSMCHEHHWDLVAELLVCWDCIRLTHGFVYQRAWEALELVQRADGSIPGPEWAERQHREARSGEISEADEDFAFSHHYHTTLVAIIAGSLRQKHNNAPAPLIQSLGASAEMMPRPPHLRLQQSLRSPISRAREWLQQVLDRSVRAEAVRPEVLCRLLVGLWACESSDSPSAGFLSTVVMPISDCLASRAFDDCAWSKTPPTLRLMAAGILSVHQREAQGFTGRHDFVSDAARSLAAFDDDVSTARHGGVVAARLLLNGMGLSPPPIVVLQSDVVRERQAPPLSAGTEAIDEWLSSLEAVSAHGTRDVELGAERGWMEDLLGGFSVAALRKYDLVLAARLLRAMIHFGLGEGYVDDGLSFLLLQQRQAGSFGMFGPEESILPPDYAVETALELQVTVDCVWTICEGMGHWRLYKSLGMPPRLPKSVPNMSWVSADPAGQGSYGRSLR